MKIKIVFLCFLLLAINFQSIAQYGQSDLFPEIKGQELLEKIVEDYKANILFFDYGTSRDTMFRNVYAVKDSLSCVYSGHTVYMDPNEDPTTTVYMNGIDNGINTEHTFPQSKGARNGNARSDMHHLYPARIEVNAERSNFSFGDIDDNDTDVWFYMDQSSFSKPSSNIDEYSEWKWQTFEPRESHKGNVARAMMYFYTMYKDQADDADPVYFSGMIPTLCNWHFLDPVDSLEYERTNLIAKWQVYPNPFVLDCSLASRTYCDIVNDACQLAVGIEDISIETEWLEGYYSSAENSFKIKTSLEEAALVDFRIYEVSGRLIQSNLKIEVLPGIQDHQIKNNALSTGIYFIQAHIHSNNHQKLLVEKINVIR